MLNKKIIPYFFMLFSVLFLQACAITSDPATSNEPSASKGDHSASYVQALSAMRSGEYKKAQALLITTVNQQPNFSNAHLNLGISYVKNKSLSEAENAFKHAIRSNPENITAYNHLGILYRALGKFSDAEKAYLHAINIDSDYAFAHLNLGILYDLYLYDIPNAIDQYNNYLTIIGTEDKQVRKWIVALKRRNKK